MPEHRIDVGGRTVCVAEAGEPEGHAVFCLHGTPGSRLFWHEVVEDAGKRGIRLIAYDRPGYGGSDPDPGRVVADAADDIAAIADALGVERYAVYGGSGGGPHALANAVRPERVVAVAALASVAPWGADGLDWLDEWDSSLQGNVLPVAVEVTLELDPPAKGNGPSPTAAQVVAAGAPYSTTRVFFLPGRREPVLEGGTP